ncbi:MAG: sulfur carrier protein ThiS [Cytophagales bacterium]
MGQIKVNKDVVNLEDAHSTSLELLLNNLGIANQKGIAIAVNDSVVPKKDWELLVLKENDQITIIQATQGG